MTALEAVIFTGIQATGKSTFYKERFFNTHIRINLDMLRTRFRENLLLRACLEGKQAFVADNTNTLAAERALYITAARSVGFSVVGYYFSSKIEDAIRRNEGRSGKERIPVPGLLMMHKRLEIPQLAEGFDRLYSVEINPAGGFEVQEWNDGL